MTTLPLLVFASLSNLNVAVFNSENGYYFVPITSFKIEGDLVNYTDIAGFTHQCLRNYFYFLYSKNSDKFLKSFQSQFGKGSLEYIPNPPFIKNKKESSYSANLNGIDYDITYLPNGTLRIRFDLQKSGIYNLKIYGYVDENDFSAFSGIIDGTKISNLFSNDLFFFLNKSIFNTSITGLSSCLFFKGYLEEGKHCLTLIPRINPDYLYLTDITLQ